jgi:hypothetical protein
MRCLLLAATFSLFAAASARAITLRVSAPALERTLKNQVFTTAPPKPGLPNRRYLRGNGTSGCSIFVDTPQVEFAADRVVVHVHSHANFGATIKGHCIGVWINTESTVSFIPEAEGESIGFRDAHVDKLTDSKELNALLEPFLARHMPQEMKINAADLMRTMLIHAPGQTGYTLTLTALTIHSMEVQQQELFVDLDADIRVD